MANSSSIFQIPFMGASDADFSVANQTPKSPLLDTVRKSESSSSFSIPTANPSDQPAFTQPQQAVFPLYAELNSISEEIEKCRRNASR